VVQAGRKAVGKHGHPDIARPLEVLGLDPHADVVVVKRLDGDGLADSPVAVGRVGSADVGHLGRLLAGMDNGRARLDDRVLEVPADELIGAPARADLLEIAVDDGDRIVRHELAVADDEWRIADRQPARQVLVVGQQPRRSSRSGRSTGSGRA